MLYGVPEISTGKPGRSSPVVALSACRNQWELASLPPLCPVSRRVVTYSVPVVGSITGVEVEPRLGVRSVHPIVLALNGVPKVRSQRIEPVAASTPYALAFSVVAITIPS